MRPIFFHEIFLRNSLAPIFDLHPSHKQSIYSLETVKKNIFVQFTAISGITWDVLTLWPVVYWVDTTPPPLTNSFSWPSTSLAQSSPLSFSRDSVTDAGVWVDEYLIQLSHTNTFATVMEFTTTWTTLTLWWGSLTPWQRYRRRWARDALGNIIYSTSTSFLISSPVVSGGGWGGSSFTPVPQQPTPISDQCPQGDNSGNFFDWLCTKVIKPPVLRNIPFEHQTAATQPRWQKMFQKLNQPTEDRIFVFPNYDAPKPFTIYEYDAPNAPNISLGTEQEKSLTNIPVVASPEPAPQTAQTTNVDSPSVWSAWSSDLPPWAYLYEWYTFEYPTCSTVLLYCPVDPVTQESVYWCAE